MRTPEEIHELGEQAVALRLAGKSLREIKQALGPMSNSTLHRALKGVPPPEWTKRPNAKDDLRAKARELRAQGLDYEDIAAELHVSKSSVSLWVRDLPVPERLSYEETRTRANEGVQKYWDAEREVRDAQRCAEQDAAAAEIGELTDRELRIAGAIAYWCEGAKSKPYRRQEEVNFINSDPRLILLFLRLLNSVGVPPGPPAVPGPHPRERRRCGNHRVLEEPLRGSTRPVHQAQPQAPQPHDHKEEHRHRLPRLLAGPGPEERQPLPQDRRLGGGGDGRVVPCASSRKPVPWLLADRNTVDAFHRQQDVTAIRRSVIGSAPIFGVGWSWFESRRRNVSR